VTPTVAPRTVVANPNPQSVTPKPLPAHTRHINSRVRFVDVASAAGLNYRWTIPGGRPINALQGIGNGCAFLDYDNDGNLDILLVGPKLALYKGDGNGHFTDVTAATGLDKLSGHFLGCAVGDYDNDGFDDLYISGYQTGLLLHNEQGKGFKDVTKEAGIKPQPWGTSAAFADIDGDGYLDLYICDYLAFGPNTPQLCDEHGVKTSCSPRYYYSLHGVLYHNLAGRRFEDVTQTWNVKHTGNGLGVAFADFDGSGRIGFVVANDELGGDLFRNLGQGRLENINVKSGTVGDKNGRPHGGMGADWGDVDNDGKLDLFVTTFQNEAKCLYHNEGSDLFTETSDATGIDAVTRPYVAFGCKFIDADNDGWLDLLIANGHIQDNIADFKKGPGCLYRQPVQFLHNDGSDHPGGPVFFEDAGKSAGLDKLPLIVGRGLAIGDFDNDGRMDALVVDSEGNPLLLHNESRKIGHWLGVRLEGSQSNRDAYGAVLTVRAGKRRLLRQCQAGGSYMSSSDKRVHFGLGSAAHIDSLTVRWPSGRTTRLSHPPIDRYLTLQESSTSARP
jgi:hypothetical protein